MVTATTYDEFDRVLTQTVVFGTAEALTSTWTYAHTNGGGSSCGSCSNSNTPATMTTPDGVVTKYEYDLEWRLYKTTVGYGTNLAQVTEHDLDIHGRVTRTIAPDGAQTLYTYEDPTFADAHHPTTPPLVEGTGGLKTTTDPLGRVIENHYYMDSLQLIRRVETPDAPGANTGLRVTEYTYADVAQGYEPESTTVYPGEADQIQQTIDTAGRVTKTTHTANGIGTLVAKTTYDAKGRVVETSTKADAEPEKTYTTAYDDLDRSITSTRPAVVGGSSQVAATHYLYNKASELVETERPDGKTETAQYDTMGRKINATDAAGETTAYTYDNIGRQTTMIWPDNTAETIAYDSAGRIASKTSRSGATQTLYYDELSRFEGLDWSENTPSTYLSYDAANRVILSDTDQVYTDTTYNAAGQLTSQTTWTDTEYPTVAYTYDQLGRRNKMTYPGGREIRYTYDNQSRVREIADQNQTLATYRYDIEGRLAQKTLTNATNTLYE